MEKMMTYRDTQVWDTLIKNATIFDGSGKPAFTADVAINGKYITAIGKLEGTASLIIDARYRALAPGFIDVHTHDDYAVLGCPGMDFKIMQGVTTEIVGNCGFGPAPFQAANFLRALYPKMHWSPFEGYAGYVRTLRVVPVR